MTDAAIIWSGDVCEGDLEIVDFDLATERGLRSAMLISIFTDARADADELPEGETDRRGWWGDGLSGEDRIGSRVWLLQRAKQTAETAALAETYVAEALAWMVEDAVALAVDVVAEWVARGHLAVDDRHDAAGRVPAGVPVRDRFGGRVNAV